MSENSIVEITRRTYEVISHAESCFNVNLNPAIKFDLTGLSAAQAIISKGELTLRYNVQAINKGFDHVMNDTVPHEVAHLVNYILPKTGNAHNKGWRSVCKVLGGTGERCHNIQLDKARTSSMYLYSCNGEEVLLGPGRHRKTQQNKFMSSYTFKSAKGRLPIFYNDFVRKI